MCCSSLKARTTIEQCGRIGSVLAWAPSIGQVLRTQDKRPPVQDRLGDDQQDRSIENPLRLKLLKGHHPGNYRIRLQEFSEIQGGVIQFIEQEGAGVLRPVWGHLNRLRL